MNRSRLPLWEWALVVSLVLAAWALRVWQPAQVPPGWRDDELINIHALTGEVLSGHPTLYFTGASGHEPLYHTLHAGALPLVGMNPLGGHLLSIACGTLTIPLTYALGRRLLSRSAGLLAATFLTSSFWSLMYSRIALRHAMVLPFALAALYGMWRSSFIGNRLSRIANRLLPVGCGLSLAAALYTYTVARLLPLILLTFGLYLALVHRDRFRRWWRFLLAVLLVAAALTAPLWVAIARGRSEAAAQGIGADARIAELSGPLRELQGGDLGPLIENARTTLGMFHATGDPEWLYNLSGRPVFGPVGAALFFAGLAFCFCRFRRPEYAFLLIWLAFGISPALITLPPSSLGHTILAQPAVYLLMALPLAELRSRIRDLRPRIRNLESALPLLAIVMVASLVPVAARDLHDYFIAWPARGMVRFLYREDYREAARYLDDHPEVIDVAVGSTLVGPWDRLALENDLRREDLRARLFNPERALLLPAGPAPAVLFIGFPEPDPALAALLEVSPVQTKGRLKLYRFPVDLPLPGPGPTATFANGLELTGLIWPDGEPAPGREATAWLVWRLARTLDLPPVPVVANPPPPGVYAGPRLAVFTHLFAADGTFLVGDDGLWVDPTTLRPGDRFIQIHRFSVLADAPPGPYRLEIGLYDPMTGERWRTAEGVDRVGWGE